MGGDIERETDKKNNVVWLSGYFAWGAEDGAVTRGDLRSDEVEDGGNTNDILVVASYGI